MILRNIHSNLAEWFIYVKNRFIFDTLDVFDLNLQKNFNPMEKITSILILFLAIFSGMASGAPKEEQPVLPVIVRKQHDRGKHTFAPPAPIHGTIIVQEGGLIVSLPLEGDDFQVNVSSESSLQVWSGSSSDSSQIEISFDGEAGEYHIEIATPDGSYTGWFEL